MNFFIRALKRAIPRSIRNWLKSPTNSLLWVWDELKHLLGLNPAISLRKDWTLKCHPRAARWFVRHVLNDPEQSRELDHFISLAHNEMVLFDIGAHFGLFSLAAMHYGGTNARIVAVDPSPSAVRLIRRQLTINNYEKAQYQVLQAAVGDHLGTLELVSVGPLAGGYYVPPEPTHSKADLSSIDLVTVDKIIERTGWLPTHLKVDVEGAEAAVLRGAVKVLQQEPPPILCLELHNEMIRMHGDDPMTSPDLLEAMGYQFTTLGNMPITKEMVIAPNLIRVSAAKKTDKA